MTTVVMTRSPIVHSAEDHIQIGINDTDAVWATYGDAVIAPGAYQRHYDMHASAPRLTSRSRAVGTRSMSQVGFAAGMAWRVLSPLQEENRLLRNEVAALEGKTAMLENTVSQLECEVDCLQDALAGLEVSVVDGYFVRVWKDVNNWIGYCPAVGAVVELDSKEKALTGVTEDMQEMLGALAALGEPAPEKDINC